MAGTRRKRDRSHVLTNVDQIVVTGKKMTDKIYYKHTGYVGHLKEKTLEQKMEKDPRWVLQRAVRKMLPRNFLTQKRIKNLVFLEGEKVVRTGKKGITLVKPVKTSATAATTSAK